MSYKQLLEALTRLSPAQLNEPVSVIEAEVIGAIMINSIVVSRSTGEVWLSEREPDLIVEKE